MQKVLRIFPLVLIWILSLLLSANARQDGGRDEKNPDKKERQKITVNHDNDGCVEGLKYEFKESARDLSKDEMRIDAGVEEFDARSYGDALAGVKWRDSFGYPLECTKVTERIREEKPREEKGAPKKWTTKGDSSNPKSMTDPWMDCAPTPGAPGLQAFFVEVDQDLPVGYNDPVYGEARRNEACEVLKEVSALVAMNSNPEIIFKKNPGNIPSNALAYASTYYSNTQGFHGGALWQNIATGSDPIPGSGNFDGYVVTNFYNSAFVWDVDDPSASSSFDLYTVLYHEVVHVLGFASRIPPVITQAYIDGTAYQGYTNFDKFLYATESSTLNLLNPIAPPFLNNPYTGTIGSPSPELVSNQAAFKNAPMSAPLDIYPVYSPGSWQSGSSMSHFNDNALYLMHPFIDPNISKDIHAHEKQALCQIGYSLNGFVCGNHPPVAVDDVDLTQNQTQVGEEICINVIVNDYDPDGDSFTLNSMNVILGGNAGSLTYWNADQTAQLPMNDPQTSIVCYTPAANFQGVAWLQYTLTDGNVGNTGNIKINIISSTCLTDPTNLICNGDFEQGSPGLGAHFEINGCPSNVPFWCTLTNGGFLLDREYDFERTYNSPVPNLDLGPDTRNGSPNDRYYSAFIDGNYENFAYIWGVFTQPLQPLDPAKTYELSFYFYPYAGDAAGLGSANAQPMAPKVILSADLPVPSETLGSSDQVIYLPDSYSLNQAWEYHSVVFSPDTSQQKYIIITAKRENPVNAVFPWTWFGYDDVVLREIPSVATEVDIAVNKSVNNSSPQPGNSITYIIRVQNMGSSMATDIHISDYLPQGVIHQDHTQAGATNGFNAEVMSDEYANNVVSWIINTLTPNEWIDLTVTVKVDESAECQTLRNVAIMTEVAQTDVASLNHYIDPSAPGFPFTPEAENYIGKKDIQVQCSGAVSGRIFNDLNGNGIKESNEPGVASMQAELYREENGQVVIPAIASAFSTADPLNYGFYQFSNIVPGTYYVKLNNPSSWTKTAPLPGAVTINGDNQLHQVVVDGDSHPDKDFGIVHPDIAVNKSVNVSQANVGDPVIYTINVINNGSIAHNVVVSDPLPAGLDFVSFSLDGPNASFDPTSGELIIPELANGETVALTLNAVPDWTTCKTIVTNVASLVSLDEEDFNSSNNTFQASFLVYDCSTVDIEIKKDVRFIKNFPGYQHVTYGIQAKNLGPAAAHAVVIVDKIPNNAVYVSHQAPAGTTASYNAVTKTVTWKIFELGVNQTKHLKLIVKRLLNQPLTNTAKLKSVLEEDTNPSNNSSTHVLP